jgi:TrmH family RNA methyltransferase
MKLDDIKKLQQRKYREAAGYFLIEGEHLILELQKAAQKVPLLQQAELYVSGEHKQWPSQFATHVISDTQMGRISETKTPPGIIAVVPMLPPPPPPSAQERTIYLYEIQDPGNLGTILRTLAWFGNFRCLLSPGSVDPYNSKVVRASMGAIFHVPLEVEVALESLQARYDRFAYLDMKGEHLRAPSFKTFACYLFGNEARGVPREQLVMLDAKAFTIEGHGAVESLNLAAAVNICAYELNQQ